MRMVRPEDTWSKKLTFKQVQKIRKDYAEGKSQGSLASTYEVSRALISQIVNNQIWNHS